MFMVLFRLKWLSIRLFNYTILILNILTFGLFIFVIAPYTSYFFFGDWRFWKYLNYFFKFQVCSINYLRKIFSKDGSFIVMHLPLTDRPLKHPDSDKFSISKDWPYGHESCGTCKNCCFLADCCFLDKKNNRCLCYDTIFWHYFNCGRYPASKEHLVFYDCKKYKPVG